MGTFWIGHGVGINFQLRTMANITRKRDALSTLSELNSVINKDIFQTFEKEGALDGYSKWAPLNPEYARKKRKQGYGNKILTRKWHLGDSASNGKLAFLDNGNRMVLAYRMGGKREKIEKYAYAIFFGRRSSTARVRKPNPKGKRRFTARVLAQGITGGGFMPGRPFIRIRKVTVDRINERVGQLWADRNVATKFVRMASE
jgi:hypothetical protein